LTNVFPGVRMLATNSLAIEMPPWINDGLRENALSKSIVPVHESGDNKRSREYHGSQRLDKAKVRIGERTYKQN
jgi:hypothetical protein